MKLKAQIIKLYQKCRRRSSSTEAYFCNIRSGR